MRFPKQCSRILLQHLRVTRGSRTKAVDTGCPNRSVPALHFHFHALWHQYLVAVNEWHACIADSEVG